MSNPTLSAGSQFNAPFNILPDVIYTNPTSNGGSQFNAPFNILPDTIYPNPTAFVNHQFLHSTWEDWAPTINAADQSLIPGILTDQTLDSLPSGTYTKSDLQFVSKNKEWRLWQAPEAASTNISGKGVLSNVIGSAVLSAASGFGIPQVSQAGQSTIQAIGTGKNSPIAMPQYATLTLDQLKPLVGVLYSDFRSRRILENGGKTAGKLRLDGTSAAFRGSFKAGAYAALAASPIGAYSVFNLNGAGQTGYGWGDHDNPYAIRNDFTARSHVAKKWDKVTPGPNGKAGAFIPTSNFAEKLIPFRGDRVNVIDFGKRKIDDAYLWKPSRGNSEKFIGKQMNKLSLTQDFIKFFMTGPKLFNGAKSDTEDDIMVFRASINSLSDSFNANWSPITMIGRADPNYQYTAFGRDLSLDFTVYATDRDEMQPIWRKLNALAGYTAPTYAETSIALQAPWMRITIGDLFVKMPVLLTSLSYTLQDADTTWEINIEDDPTMMQAPHKVSVSCQFTVIGDDLPQKNGRFYTLAKEWDASGSAKVGTNNWLSDSLDNSTLASDRELKKWNRKGGKGAVDEAGNITKK